MSVNKTVTIVQSNYIPWKGYFDLIRRSDVFVLYDDVQYTRRDWRNRNRIKTPNGLQWLTIPVEVKGKYTQEIREVKIADDRWRDEHWKTLRHAYSRAPFFKSYAERIEALYRGADSEWLSEVNRYFIEGVCELLGIRTDIRWSTEFSNQAGKSERLLGICRELNATAYLSGPAAKSYLDEGLFASAGIGVEWMDYSGYPEYPQLYGPFEHGVTVLDLIFNAGPDAGQYLLSHSEERARHG
jgi:hypothetical protein